MNTALLVIDMQNDYLWPARKPRFAYDTDALVASVNAIIRRCAEEGCGVAYIRHIIQNLPTNRLLFGFSLAGTPGAELYAGLKIVGENRFDKYFGDALTSASLRRWLEENGVERLRLCGLDRYGCVTATALGAKKRGYEVAILEGGTATVMPEGRAAKARRRLDEAGIEFIED